MTRGQNKPIAILGFGRSGTSWISDIVSKSQGGLILFEPMFPNALANADEYCYSRCDLPAQEASLRNHLELAMAGGVRDKWLLRNHLNQSVEETGTAFAEAIWNHCRIIGFKEIRASFLLEKLERRWCYRTLFVVRHPFAVLASLRNRPWFWKGDFGGLRNHYRMFCHQVLNNKAFADQLKDIDIEEYASATDELRQQAILWAITHKIVLNDLRKLHSPVLFYEDLFLDPFNTSKLMLRTLGMDANRIHPAYLFTPSMATLKTTHELNYDRNPMRIRGPSMFWEGILDNKELDTIWKYVEAVSLNLYDDLGHPNINGTRGLNLIRSGDS